MPVLLSLVLPSALAVAPPDAADPGVSPVVRLAPQRLQPLRPATQASLAREPLWQRFLQDEGDGWRALFDEHTGLPRTLWGRGPLVPTDSGAAVAKAVEDWLYRHADLFGIEPGGLTLRTAEYEPALDVWYVELDDRQDGLRTYRGGVSARVKHDRLVLVHAATAPRARLTGAYHYDESAAIARAIHLGPAPKATHTEVSAERILLDRKTVADGHELRRTWMVRSRTAEPPGIWVTFVDGATGELLNVHNEVRFVDGTVTARHHERTVDDALITSPVPLAVVTGDVDSDVTDLTGAYSVTDSATYTTDFDGAYLELVNAAGPEAVLSSSSPDLRWTASDADQAEIDAYIFTHQIREWGEVAAPEVRIVNQKITANVNINNACNAFYNGEMNFYLAGSGCNNTAQIADVVYHEWGHGFHFFSLRAGFFDGSLSEGAADTVAFLQTGDSVIAPFFRTNGNGIRNVGPNRVYPDQFVNSPYAVHSNGLIFGGTMWDLWNLLKAKEGEEAGTQSLEQIFTGLLKGGTDIPGTWGEALVADDDDGDLANGTPHYCEMLEAFGDHGLGPAAGEALVLVSHEPIVDPPAGLDHELTVDLVDLQEACSSGDVVEATVYFRTRGESTWLTADLTPDGPSALGAIPEQDEGALVEYYVTGESSEGGPFTVPVGGATKPLTFKVGDALEIRCQGFEGGDGGYTSELVAGKDVDGANDWQWGTPLGDGLDPAVAYQGTLVWGNDLGDGNFNGNYQPNKHNALESRRIRTDHYTGVYLQYRRWLTVEDGAFDQARILANGEEVWANHVGTGDQHHLDQQWVSHVVDLGGVADQGGVRIRWELISDPGLEFGGWTIDDVCILAPATPDNRLGIDDFVAETTGDIRVSLSWTQPEHEPVEQVRVVRRHDRFPEGPDDGTLVYQVDEPVLGGEVTVDDLNHEPGDAYYAVYASDGVDWLSWTIEGLNAAQVDVVGGSPWPRVTPTGADGGEGSGSSAFAACGCAGAPGAPAWLALPLLGLLIARRRSAG